MAEMRKWKYEGTGEEGGVDFAQTMDGLGHTKFGIRFVKRPDYDVTEIWVEVTPKGRKTPARGLVYLTRDQVEELYKAMCK